MADRIAIPFAENGDTLPVPETSTGTEMSFNNGWPSVYQLKKTEAGSRSINREQHNELWRRTTANIKEWQETLAPRFITAEENGGDFFAYPLGMIVSTDTGYRRSKIADNDNIVTDDDYWEDFEFASKTETVELTGSATFTGIDNKIVMTGIVTALGLEVGDVIQFTDADANNNKPRTVESITDDNTIIVNYEHCGNRGDGSLKLTDETKTVTCSFVEKGYLSPIGLGQDWVDIISYRSTNSNYTNNTGRTMSTNVVSAGFTNSELGFFVDGVLLGHRNSVSGISGGRESQTSAVVKNNSIYRQSGGDIQVWSELR